MRCYLCNKKFKGKLACPSCLKEYYAKCKICGIYDLKEEMSWDDLNPKHYYCYKCADRYLFRCNSCGKTSSHKNFATSRPYRCKKCMNVPKEFIALSKANYIPNPLRFHKLREEKNPMYMGFELEIESFEGRSIFNLIKDLNVFLVKKKINKFYYFKEDISLTQGFEIVTYPSTYAYIEKYFKLEDVIQYLKNRVKVTKRCGLHIHISKEALSHQSIAALQYFTYRNRRELFCLSGRDISFLGDISSSVYSKNKLLGKLSYFSYVKSSKEYVREGYINPSKFLAVAGRKNTIEFRLFGATLSYEKLNSNLILVLSLIKYFQQTSAEVILDFPAIKHFFKFVKREKEYKPLENILKCAKEKTICGMKVF